MRNIKSIYLAGTNVCNLVIVFATLFYLFFALFYCYSLSGVQLKDRSLSPTVEISTILTKKNLLYFWPCLDTRCVDSFDVERTYPYLTFLQSHSLHFNVRKSIHQKLPCTSEVFLMGPCSKKETLKVKLNQ